MGLKTKTQRIQQGAKVMSRSDNRTREQFEQVLKMHLAHPELTTTPAIREGLLTYYFYNRPDFIAEGNNPCLLMLRANEIRQELHELAEDHTHSTVITVASGQTYRLLRSFCSLIVNANTNTFNSGGAEAVIELLSNPTYRLSYYLHPEHRKQVIRVVQCCLKSEKVQTLLVRPFTPHPEMRELIALSLKIPEEAVGRNPAQISHALLLTLLSHVKQRNLKNCYALAPLILEIHVSPDRLLKELVDLLHMGHFVFENRSKIDTHVPILPIIHNRLNNEYPLEIDCQSDKAISHPAIALAASLLDMDTQVTPHKKRPLTTSLKSRANYPSLVRYLTAFDNCPLQQLLLINRELKNMNHHQKAALIDMVDQLFSPICYAAIPFNGAHDSYTPIRKAFSELLYWELWFEDIPISTVAPNGFGPSFDRRPLPEEVATNENLQELIQQGRFLFAIRNSHYTRINTISEFQQYLVEKSAELPISDECKAYFAVQLNRKNIADRIAAHLKREAKLYNISVETLITANLMVFPQTGGASPTQLKDCKLKLSSATPKKCLKELLKLFREQLSNWHLPVLVSNRYHCFTMAPDYFSHLPNKKSPQEIIDHEVAERFSAFLNTPVLAAAQAYLSNKMQILGIETASDLTYHTLLKKLRRVDSITVTPSFYEDVIFAFSLIECSTDLISALLTDLSLDPQQANRLYKKLDNPHLTTQHFAEQLSLLLQKEGMAIIDPVKLEYMVCKHTDRPISFVIGSLNWAGQMPESNSVAWEIVLEPVTEQLVYVQRENGKRKQLVENPEEFSTFYVFPPKYTSYTIYQK